jgi:transposase
MARPYSDDLRTRVLDACEAHEGTFAEIAQRFRIAESTLHNWRHAQKQDQRTTAKAHAGGPERKLDAQDYAWMREHVEAKNDLTLKEYAVRLREERGKKVSISTVSRTLILLKLPRKKRL